MTDLEGQGAERDQRHLGGVESLLDSGQERRVVRHPVSVMDHRVEMEADDDSPVGHPLGGVQALIEPGSPLFFVLDDALRIEGPGTDEVAGNRIFQ